MAKKAPNLLQVDAIFDANIWQLWQCVVILNERGQSESGVRSWVVILTEGL